MNETEAVLTLKLISLGYAHSDALRDEAIRVVIAEWERLGSDEAEDWRAESILKIQERADRAEARVKELEAERDEARESAAHLQKTQYALEDRVLRLRATRGKRGR